MHRWEPNARPMPILKGRLHRVFCRGTVCTAALFLAAFLSNPSSASATSIEVAGATLGCFGVGCSVYTSPTSFANDGLTFTGVDSFDEFTTATGSVSGINLGSFSRDNVNVSDATPPLDFQLLVTFSLPTGINSGGPADAFTAVIHATTPGGGGPLDVDFDNAWQHITFSNAAGSGSFDFAITSDLAVTKNGTELVYGAIRNATDPALDQVAAVPEPASIVLLGSGLVSVGTLFKRNVGA